MKLAARKILVSDDEAKPHVWKPWMCVHRRRFDIEPGPFQAGEPLSAGYGLRMLADLCRRCITSDPRLNSGAEPAHAPGSKSRIDLGGNSAAGLRRFGADAHELQTDLPTHPAEIERRNIEGHDDMTCLKLGIDRAPCDTAQAICSRDIPQASGSFEQPAVDSAHFDNLAYSLCSPQLWQQVHRPWRQRQAGWREEQV